MSLHVETYHQYLATQCLLPGGKQFLSSGNSNWLGDKGTVMAAGELKYGKGVFRICELQLLDRIKSNPTAFDFFMKMLGE